MTALPDPPVTVERIDTGDTTDYELNLRPGATAAAISTALIAIPAYAELADWYGDVHATFVFRGSRPEVPSNRR